MGLPLFWMFNTGSLGMIYLMGMALIAGIAVSLFRDRRGMDLSINNQAEQEVGTTVFRLFTIQGVAVA